MFGFFKSAPSSKIQVMGHDVAIALIVRDGKILYTGEVVKNYPKEHLEGKVFEVSFTTKSGNPYFVYYLCEDYYFAVAAPGASASFGGPLETEKFRVSVSQNVAKFLVEHLKSSLRSNAGADIKSFSHNRVHTNVLAYVESLNEWYPIQHNDSEDDEASERKVLQVNSRRLKISNVIAINEPSPHA